MNKKLEVMEMAFEHAREVFKKGGGMFIEYYEDEDDPDFWEFNVTENGVLHDDDMGCSFDEKSLPQK